MKQTRAPSEVFNCLSFTISWPVSTSLKFGAKFFSNSNAGVLLLGGYFPVGKTTENVNIKKQPFLKWHISFIYEINIQ